MRLTQYKAATRMTAVEQLAKKTRVHRGHRSSTTRILGQVQPSITSEPLDVSKVTQLKRSLEGKLQSLSTLDDEILALTPEAIEDEIVQADVNKEHIHCFSQVGTCSEAFHCCCRPC